MNIDKLADTLTKEIEAHNFAKSVYLDSNAEPWAECTNEEKLAWEEAHKPEEPQEAEVVVE